MNIRVAATGVFLSCSGYDLPVKERCKTTRNLLPGDEVSSASSQNEEEGDVGEILAKRRCARCGSLMDSYLLDQQHKLHICGNSPDCSGWEMEQGAFKLKGYDGPALACDLCGAPMQLKSGRFGKYFSCSRYPECKNTRKLLRTGQPAPAKSSPVPMPELKCKKSDAYFLLRDGAAGLFLAAHTFPKSREPASPKVKDLARHRTELAEKFHYLADAPQCDPDGHDFEIRFKRKEKIQYLVSVLEDGSPAGWTAYYENDRWQMKQEKVRSSVLKAPRSFRGRNR